MPVLPVYVKHQNQQHVKSSFNLGENHVTDAGENRLMYILDQNYHIYIFMIKEILSKSLSFGKDIRKLKDTG